MLATLSLLALPPLLLARAKKRLFTVTQKLVKEYGGVYEQRWLGENVFLLFAATVFGVRCDAVRRKASLLLP